jgi:hypothetical protein
MRADRAHVRPDCQLAHRLRHFATAGIPDRPGALEQPPVVRKLAGAPVAELPISVHFAVEQAPVAQVSIAPVAQTALQEAGPLTVSGG